MTFTEADHAFFNDTGTRYNAPQPRRRIGVSWIGLTGSSLSATGVIGGTMTMTTTER